MNKKRLVALLLVFVMLFSNMGNVFASENTGEQDVDASVWTPEDFTYKEYEKLLYGCDYSRQIVIKGIAISGFSESGEAKLAQNKDLVIPATNPEGVQIVGIADSAFKNKGLTSVEFPTGMMVRYDDTITNKVTKRGNFIIADSAFAGNEITSVTLPEGVIACLPYAFNNNKIETVRLPRTIWWLETMSFAKNYITTLNFPITCDFQLEMHGMAFAHNFIQSVRLPDYTEVVNKDTFAWNLGSEPLKNVTNENYLTYTKDGQTYEAGFVYMYTDNAELAIKDRIHHNDKSTSSQKSQVQKLIVNNGTEATQNPNLAWTVDDFTYDGATITGFSETGITKRATNKELILPDTNKSGQFITAIAAGTPGGHGLFATETEKFDYVYLPTQLRTVGDYAFQNSGLKEVTFPARLQTIGKVAFQTNDLTSVILPDTVTILGEGAFATNPKLERISLSLGLTEIAASAFGCSDGKNWMTNLRSIELHEGITKIGSRAFAANNFSEIVLPSTVKELGSYAFSTKNYLTTPCTVTLNEGLETIGSYAFRNKVISEITLPTTVTKLNKNTFLKEYSDDTQAVVTKVYVSLKSQYTDKANFPDSDHHKIYLIDSLEWTAEDFVYGKEIFQLIGNSSVEAWVIKGLSDLGERKIENNKQVIIPVKDPEGNGVQGIGEGALKNQDITAVLLPEGLKFIGEDAFRNNALMQVTIPSTIMQLAAGAFAENDITTIQFPVKTDTTFQMEAQAFASNQLQAIQLPANTVKVDKTAFAQNPGVKDGVVYMYQDATEAGAYIEYKSAGTSDVQELFLGTLSEVLSNWSAVHFTFDEEGTTITGFSEYGKEKIKLDAAVILPEVGPSGKEITALGDGVNNQGIFVVTEEGKNYTPKSVMLPKTLTKIGTCTFALSGTLTYEAEMVQIVFPNGLVEIGQTAFQNSKLTSVELPNSVTTLGSGAFTGSSKITSIVLSNQLTIIPQSAFVSGNDRTENLKTLVIPEGVTSIGRQAFAGTRMEGLELPSTLTLIDQQAFQNHQLTELTIPGSVTSIGKYAFRMNQEALKPMLTDVTLNEGLVTIGQYAFENNAITEIELPSTVVLSAQNKAADLIFGTASKPADPIVVLKVNDKTKVETFNTEYANANSHVVVYDNLVGSSWNAQDFTYDEETATITGWSESGQEKRKTLKALVLPDKTPNGKDIVSVGEEAFKIPNDEVVITKFGIDSPNGMTSLVLPENVKEIGVLAFAQNALTIVDLTGLTSIEERAFYGNDLVKAEIPDTVTALGAGAFATNDITELRLSKNVTVIPQGAFSMNIRMEQVEIPDTVTEICATAFAGARLTSLEIPKSVVKIGEKAFHLHHLTELTIPGNVKEVGDSAFEGTFKATTLKTLIIEEGVESIGKYAFKEALLETVHFPNSLKTVGEKPFLNNKGKNGSGVVEVTTRNVAHTNLQDSTYVINYLDAGKWIKDGIGWWYQNADGTYPTSAWKHIGLDWYYFDEVGYMVTGWKQLNGAWYYLASSGAMVTGMQSIGNVKYYFDENGVMATGWKVIDEKWYYFAGSGAMSTGWQKVGGLWYFMGSGAMVTGWQKIGGTWYYLMGSGAMATKWQLIDGTWYYFAESGAMCTGWQLINGVWYYLDSNGTMVIDWKNIGGVWYYFAESGAMVTGRKQIGEDWYYFAQSGAMETGWHYIEGVWYNFGENGAMIQ